RLVDMVDQDVDAHLRPPVLGKLVEPRVVAGHEVAPQQDLQVARELLARLGEGLFRRFVRVAGRAGRAALLARTPGERSGERTTEWGARGRRTGGPQQVAPRAGGRQEARDGFVGHGYSSIRYPPNVIAM